MCRQIPLRLAQTSTPKTHLLGGPAFPSGPAKFVPRVLATAPRPLPLDDLRAPLWRAETWRRPPTWRDMGVVINRIVRGAVVKVLRPVGTRTHDTKREGSMRRSLLARGRKTTVTGPVTVNSKICPPSGHLNTKKRQLEEGRKYRGAGGWMLRVRAADTLIRGKPSTV